MLSHVHTTTTVIYSKYRFAYRSQVALYSGSLDSRVSRDGVSGAARLLKSVASAAVAVEPLQLAAIAAEPVAEVAVLAAVGAVCAQQGLLPLQGRCVQCYESGMTNLFWCFSLEVQHKADSHSSHHRLLMRVIDASQSPSHVWLLKDLATPCWLEHRTRPNSTTCTPVVEQAACAMYKGIHQLPGWQCMWVGRNSSTSMPTPVKQLVPSVLPSLPHQG